MKHVKVCKECGGPTNHERGCWCPFCSGACEMQYDEDHPEPVVGQE